jgi:hypothetical protein
MAGRLKQQWRKFRNGRPGRRFQARYEQNKKRRSSQSWFVRLLKPMSGIILIAGGLVLCFIPGPGVPFIVIGAGLLADEARPIARAMDRLEIRAREILAWAHRWWNHAPTIAKYAVIFLAVLAGSGAAYGGYRFIASH